MSKVKANLLKINLKAGQYKAAVKLACMLSVQNNRIVHLDNAYDRVSEHMSRHEFAGYLSALTADGVYRPMNTGTPSRDKFFGEMME